MAKWKSVIILLILMLPLVIATQVEISTDNSTWESISEYGGVVNESNNEGFIPSLQPGTLYYIRARNETTSWSYTSQRTRQGGEGIMASLAVILFLGAINGAMFWLGIKGKLSENELLNFILKRSLIILGLLFTSLNLAVLANIANNAGLGIRAEIFRYMWLFNWAIYIAIVFLMWGTVVRALGMWSDIAEKKSYGG